VPRKPSNPDTWVEDLEPIEQPENIKSAIYKTVDTFQGITKKRPWIKKSDKACTDGREICLPLDHPEAYLMCEHELAHILFKSSIRGKMKFLEEYSDQVCIAARREGVVLDPGLLLDNLDVLIGVIEDHRVNSLWGQLYPGSFRLLYEFYREHNSRYEGLAQGSLITMFVCLATGVDVGSGPYDPVKKPMQESLERVEGKGFEATLVSAKRLVMDIIDVIIQLSKHVPPPPAASKPGGGEEREEGQVQEEAGAGGGGPGDAGKGSVRERAEALGELQKMMAPSAPEIKERVNDVVGSKYPSREDDAEGERAAQAALHLHPRDFDNFIQASATAMDSIVEEAQQAIRQTMTKEDRLRKNAMAKVVFKNISTKDLSQKVVTPQRAREMLDEAEEQAKKYRGKVKKAVSAKLSHVHKVLEEDSKDQDAIRRLKARFNRIIGRRRVTLDDTGSEIDPQAWIERKLTNQPVKCFKRDEVGRGFSALVLMDRSYSMKGDKTRQCERACRIITKALRFPFVDLTIWGFQSTENGQVDIVRYDPSMEYFHVGGEHVGGATPLHTSIRLARRELEPGANAKHLFVITDGFPCYALRGGHGVDTGQLMQWVRNEVKTGLRAGIHTTCVMISPDKGDSYYDPITPTHMRFMFGHSSNWKQISPERVGDDIVALITSSFVRYLTHG
jgi:hypothetical protein